MKLILIASLALALTPGIAAANGSLKVTSFPSGAAVWVDGANTGKVTPMSISLSEGDHTVTVSIPNSGWNPDTRTVTIVTGNNDLSVTLLPLLTTGPQGPKGDKGDKGDTGDKGDKGDAGAPGAPGDLSLAGLICPDGMFVIGFSSSGQVLCLAPGATTPVPAPIPLPFGFLFDNYLRSLTGTEANGAFPFQHDVPQIGTIQGTVDSVGFALCEPPDPSALPSLTPPAYPCAPEMEVVFVANNPNLATLTIDISHVFVRLTGDWKLTSPLLPDRAGLASGFGLFTGVRIQFTIPLITTPEGLKSFGLASANVTSQASNIQMDFGDSTMNTIAGLIENSALAFVRGAIAQMASGAVTAVLGTIPPFGL